MALDSVEASETINTTQTVYITTASITVIFLFGGKLQGTEDLWGLFKALPVTPLCTCTHRAMYMLVEKCNTTAVGSLFYTSCSTGVSIKLVWPAETEITIDVITIHSYISLM
jgi:hypothetical protein